MLRTALLPVACVFATAACGDDPVKNGELLVKWNTGPTAATCGTFGVTTVEARAMKGETAAAQVQTDCPASATSGEISLPDLAPGTYTIEVEGFNADDKGTYFGTAAKQKVSEGKTTETSAIVLALKPAIIGVDWTLPGGGRCSTANITDVEISLYYNASTAPTLIGSAKKVDCDSTGFELEDLVPNGDVKLIAYGYNGSKKIAKGSTDFFTLGAGDDLTEVIALETCPGDPPACD